MQISLGNSGTFFEIGRFLYLVLILANFRQFHPYMPFLTQALVLGGVRKHHVVP